MKTSATDSEYAAGSRRSLEEVSRILRETGQIHGNLTTSNLLCPIAAPASP